MTLPPGPLAPWRCPRLPGAAQRGVERGFSQEALGFACGRHRTYVSALERGTSSPTLQTVVRLARALGVDAAELVARAERELDG